MLVIPLFMGAYVWQAGDIMRSRAGTIGDYRTETSAATRFEAWDAAINMISNYPLTGVGLASFGPAFPDYSDKAPREAHNTLLQITAESGLIAGAMYVLIVSSSLIGLWKNGKRYKQTDEPDKRLLHCINEAALVSLCGLVVCSLFLSLQIFEIFYYLCLVVNSVLYLSKKSQVTKLERDTRTKAGESSRAGAQSLIPP
jgi:O-antigen ligase